jgi:SAM-dependent methyltransferase
MLAVGERGATRLRLVDNIFGPATREFLLACGLKRGWRVAEIGCGVGLVSLWMAELEASITAVDASASQIETARKYARERGISNVEFRVADAYRTELPREEFDLVYSRFLMCHLPDPVRALREMRALVKPGGILACEDNDQQSVASEPPSQAYDRLNEISKDLDKAYRVNSWDIGSRLASLFASVGLAAPQVKVRRNAFRRGGEKRLWELTLEEARPAIIERHIAKSEELDKVCAELRRIADDESVLVIAAHVTQVCARN